MSLCRGDIHMVHVYVISLSESVIISFINMQRMLLPSRSTLSRPAPLCWARTFYILFQIPVLPLLLFYPDRQLYVTFLDQNRWRAYI